MAYELRDNSGTLFKNDKRENDKQPTHNGNVMIDGKEFWISAWVKEGAKGKFFSLAFKPKDGGNRRPEPAKTPAAQRSYAEDLDDEIPW